MLVRFANVRIGRCHLLYMLMIFRNMGLRFVQHLDRIQSRMMLLDDGDEV